MFYVIGAFVVCWIPLAILCLVDYLSPRNEETHNITKDLIDNFCYCAIHFNSAINPIIYAFRIRDLRNAIKRTFGCKLEAQIHQSESCLPSRNANYAVNIIDTERFELQQRTV